MLVRASRIRTGKAFRRHAGRGLRELNMSPDGSRLEMNATSFNSDAPARRELAGTAAEAVAGDAVVVLKNEVHQAPGNRLIGVRTPERAGRA